ncbi:MAG: Fur family transcriptional regulator [Candidatus Dormibacteria bacterium]
MNLSARPVLEESARDALRAAGLRVTPQRVAILEVLSAAEGRHLSADDVFAQLSTSSLRLDRSTAYRVLADLTDRRLLTQVRFADGVARFEVQSRTHHHAVCVRCAATEDVPGRVIQPLSSALRRATGFVMAPDEPLLVRGLCAACARAQPPS